jgi:imidazolonepropionase-like amidohydrolase
MEKERKIRPTSASSNSDSSGGLFNLGPYDNPDDVELAARQKKIEDREAKRAKMDKVYHNCYFGQQTKQEKAEHKMNKIRLKRKRGRQTRRLNRRKFLESMTKEEREAYLAEQKKSNEESDLRVAEGQKSGMRVIIDCGFEREMSVKENKSLAVQITRVYGSMRAS